MAIAGVLTGLMVAAISPGTMRPNAAPALSTWVPPALMVIGVVFLGILLVISMRNRKAAAHHQETPAALPPESSLAETRVDAARRQVQDVHAMANDLLTAAQRLSTNLDHKSRQVEELLARCETRIAQISALMEQSVRHVRDEAEAARQPTIETKPVTVTGSRANQTSGNDALDPLTSAVYRLADTGRKPMEIARDLKEQVGKVELILALRGR